MADKQNSFHGSVSLWKPILFCLLCLLLSSHSFAQVKERDISNQRLLLKLASTDLNVTAQNQIDIDSGLAIASHRTGINSMMLISENFDDLVQSDAYGKVIRELDDINDLKRVALGKQGIEKTRLLSLIGYYYAFMPERSGHDSAMFYFSHATKLANSIADSKATSHILCGTGKSYLENGEVDQGNRAFEQAIGIAKGNNDAMTQARALAYWGTYSPFTPETVLNRIRVLREADSLFVKLNSTKDRISTLTNIAYLSFAGGKISDSKAAALQALELQQAVNFPYTHYTNDLLSFLTMDIEGQFGTGLEYVMKAVKSVGETGDSTSYGKFCTRVGLAYWISLEDPSAEVWLRKGLNEFVKEGEELLGMHRCMNTLCFVLKNQGKSGEAIALLQDVLKRFPPKDPLQLQESLLTLADNLAEVGQVSQAFENLRRAETLYDEVYQRSGNLMVSYVDYTIGFIYYELKNFEKGRHYLERALKPPTDLAIRFRAKAIFALARMDSARGDYAAAYANSLKHIAITDSIHDRYQSSLNQALRVQYETERKDNNIKILEQQAELRESKIREDKFIKTTMIIAVVILFLFVALLYGRFHNKQKVNKELESQRNKIAEKNDLLAQLLREKEWLLKEVHHRVKNNLQIVISLLNTQSNYLDNDAAVKAIRESQDRMFAISLIHQKLYKSDENALIHVGEYVYELLDYIKDSVSGSGPVEFDVDVNDIQLDTTQAVLLGLILNEAVSNSIKYAFKGHDSGRISISLQSSTVSNNYLLIIADDGNGLPDDFDQVNNPSFGIRLMKGLSKQMGGSFKITSNNGVTIEISFTDFSVVNRMHEESNGVLSGKV